MALQTLLQIVNQAEGELGLPLSGAVAGATSGQASQMFALINSCGRKLALAHTWGDLQVQGSITTQIGVSLYPTPADYSRMVSETQWDTSTKWPLNGPVTPQLFRALTEGPYAWPSNRVIFRQAGFRNIQVYPTPQSAGVAYNYAYISDKWALSVAMVAQDQFLADTDTSYFVSDLLVADLKWRWNAAKGLGMAGSLKIERDELLDQLKGADMGGKTLDMGDVPRGSDVSAIGSTTPGNYLISISDALP